MNAIALAGGDRACLNFRRRNVFLGGGWWGGWGGEGEGVRPGSRKQTWKGSSVGRFSTSRIPVPGDRRRIIIVQLHRHSQRAKR